MSTKQLEYGLDVRVRRSKHHRRTMSVRAEGNRIIVMIPNDLSATAGKQQVNEAAARAWRKVSSNSGNSDLGRRTRPLSCTVLGDRPWFESVRWVKNISRRWASATDGADSPGCIRIPHRLTDVPGCVLSDVVVYELVHTFVDGGYTEEFWYWTVKAPYHERARSYLETYQCWGAQS